MLNFRRFIEIVISLQLIIISTFIPVFILIPFSNQPFNIFEIPISWQVPLIIIITLIFKRNVVTIAFSIYLLIGLFLLPVFQNGGSIGYLLTPNFGFLLGIYPLIFFIDKLNNQKIIDYYYFIRYGIQGIVCMHIIGIVYNYIQLLFFNKPDILIYNISKFSLGKIGFHFLMLAPISILIKIINKNYKHRN